MTSTAAVPMRPGQTPNWHDLVGEALKTQGTWAVFQKLNEAKSVYPDDLALRGYIEIVRTTIVREFLQSEKGMLAVPKLTAEFLTDFERFNLNAQEGYLVSLIDGRLDLQKLLRVSPFDAFTTLFHLAKLQHQRAIMIPQ